MRQIMIDGIRVGYCTMKVGMPITLIVRLKECEERSVREYIEKEIGGMVSRISQPPELIDVEEDDE